MRQHHLFLGLMTGFLLFWTLPLSAQQGRSIMREVLDRNDGTSEVSRVKLSTCRYVKKNNRLMCAERPRIKIFDSVRKDYGPREKDKKYATFIRQPPGERGIGFLQYDYEEAGRDSDQWMYLAALGKVKRIVSGNKNEPKSGSFFGSEISYEDMESRRLDDYRYRVIKSVTYRKRPCLIVESIPILERARKSNYSKSVQWVDEERKIILKTLLYDRQGKPVKQIVWRMVEQIDGIWISRKLHVTNVQTRRRTTMSVEAVSFNIDFPDSVLTLRALTDSAFREQQLSRIIQTLQ